MRIRSFFALMSLVFAVLAACKTRLGGTDLKDESWPVAETSAADVADVCDGLHTRVLIYENAKVDDVERAFRKTRTLEVAALAKEIERERSLVAAAEANLEAARQQLTVPVDSGAQASEAATTTQGLDVSAPKPKKVPDLVNQATSEMPPNLSDRPVSEDLTGLGAHEGGAGSLLGTALEDDIQVQRDALAALDRRRQALEICEFDRTKTQTLAEASESVVPLSEADGWPELGGKEAIKASKAAGLNLTEDSGRPNLTAAQAAEALEFLQWFGNTAVTAKMACMSIGGVIAARITGNRRPSTAAGADCLDYIGSSLCGSVIDAATGAARMYSNNTATVSSLSRPLVENVKNSVIRCVRNQLFNGWMLQPRPGAGAFSLQGSLVTRVKNGIKNGALVRACDGALTAVGNLMENVNRRETDFQNACNFPFNRSRLASCAQTGASVCRAIDGQMNIGGLFPVDTETGYDALDRTMRISSDLTGSVVSGACQLGGRQTSALCGTISEAAGQIVTALRTGNNDWAHCAGTDQLGTCVGTVYSNWVLGYDVGGAARRAVAQPQRSGEEWSSLCCMCERQYWENRSGPDVQVMREMTFFPTEPDGGPSTCPGMFENMPWSPIASAREMSRYNRPVYYGYQHCARRWVKGRFCPAVAGQLRWDDNKRRQSAAVGVYQVWDNATGPLPWDGRQRGSWGWKDYNISSRVYWDPYPR